MELSQTTKHSWYGSFLAAIAHYGLTTPPPLTPFNLADVKKRMEETVLADIQLHACIMSRLTIYNTTPLTWSRTPYMTLGFSLAAVIASLCSSTQFLNVGRLRRVNASRRIERSARTCPVCPQEVEDERHALLYCPAFDLERRKWKRRLAEVDAEIGENDEGRLMKLCINPSGRKQMIFCTAVFVRDVLKAVKKRYYAGWRTLL